MDHFKNGNEIIGAVSRENKTLNVGHCPTKRRLAQPSQVFFWYDGTLDMIELYVVVFTDNVP